MPPGKIAADIGHLAPEMIKFVSGKDSPISKPLLLVTNELSGQVIIYMLPDDGTVIKAKQQPPKRRKSSPPPKKRKSPPPPRRHKIQKKQG